MGRLAYLWDSRKCIACGACIVACTANYPELRREDNPNPMWGWLSSNIRRVIREQREPELRLLSCQHCELAPCVTACPTRASYRDEKTGLVKIDYSKCIGCKSCVVACPYGARWIHPKTKYPEKCPGPLCSKIIEQGETPLCVAACPANARDFGDIDDPNSSISRKIRDKKTIRMMEHLGLDTKYFIVVR